MKVARPREFERTSFALLNAYVSGALGGIDELAAELASLGLKPAVLLVHSQGGSISIAEAKNRPLGLAASGPAAGVAACVTVAKAAGITDVVTCDVGGTSFDVSVIVNGEPASRTRGEVMGMWTALRQVDVESIGAGGGSIGWIDARGLLTDIPFERKSAEFATMNLIGEQTGGRAFYNTNGLKESLETAADEGSSYYSLVYAGPT